MNRIIVFIVVLVGLFSCKKDRLKDENEILVGKWRWVKTIKSLDQPQFIYSNPSMNGNNYELEFFKCGRVKYFENGNEVFYYKLKFDGNYSCDDYWCNFPFFLDKTISVKAIIYNSSKDTLYITDYPFNEFIDSKGNPDNYRNVYVRE